MFGILTRTVIENFGPLAKLGKGKTLRVFLKRNAEEFSIEVEETESRRNRYLYS